MKKIYVAFSVAGSNTFLVAENKVTDSEFAELLKNAEFEKVTSRLPASIASGYGIKLHWKRLQTKSGEPLRSPPVILSRFKELVDNYGFYILQSTRNSFVSKHWAKK